jgi:PII-like signaling protein
MLEVQVFFDEDDRYQGKPIHEHLLRYLMHERIAGASVFAAVMGYGAKHRLHEPRRLGGSDEGPLMMLVIDEAEKVRRVLPHLKEVVREGLIVVRPVDPA